MKPLTRKQRIVEELLAWLVVAAMTAAAISVATLFGGCAYADSTRPEPLPIEFYD